MTQHTLVCGMSYGSANRTVVAVGGREGVGAGARRGWGQGGGGGREGVGARRVWGPGGGGGEGKEGVGTGSEGGDRE